MRRREFFALGLLHGLGLLVGLMVGGVLGWTVAGLEAAVLALACWSAPRHDEREWLDRIIRDAILAEHRRRARARALQRLSALGEQLELLRRRN